MCLSLVESFSPVLMKHNFIFKKNHTLTRKGVQMWCIHVFWHSVLLSVFYLLGERLKAQVEV